MFANSNASRKTPLEFHFMYISNNTCHWSFKTCSIISVLVVTVCHLLHNLIFSYSNNILFTNHVLKFKYPSWQDKTEANIQKSIKYPFLLWLQQQLVFSLYWIILVFFKMKFINYYFLLCYISVLACYNNDHQFIIVIFIEFTM